MNNKKITLLIASFLLIGIAAPGVVFALEIEYIGNINPLSEIEIGDFIAGTETSAEFEFEFTDNINAAEHFPLIYEISFSNSSEEVPKVWKNDFEIKSGIVAREIWGYEFREIVLECNNEFPLTIDHQIGSETIENGENGTFYCYNTTEGTWNNLKKHNKVSLDITTHPALYPGSYNLSAKMFYLNDSYAPFVNITNKEDFELYYGKNDVVDVRLNVTDGSPISQAYGIAYGVYENGSNLDFNNYIPEGDLFKFQERTGEEGLQEGDYELIFYAQDFNGNEENDSTTIKIDLTPPEIELISPVEEKEVYADNISIEAGVSDEKAGVDKESVKVRLREIKNETICPESGVALGNYSCITTDWINLEFNETSETFKKEIDTIELNLSSGKYWLDIRAKDLLGNEAYFGE